MLRHLAAALAAIAMVLMLAAPAIAGGWAEIVADAQSGEPPVEGRTAEVGFLVLQHGVTPAGWEIPTVTFTNAATGATVDVVASNDRSDGHFVATALLPEAGYWSWQVTLRDLESEHVPVALTVRTASGQMPAYDPSTTLTAIARVRQEIIAELDARYFPEVERLNGLLDVERAKSDRALEQTNAIVAERDALATRVAAAEGAGGLPLLAVVMVAILAGAAAGFAMSWLAGRPGPNVTFSPTPREADRA